MNLSDIYVVLFYEGYPGKDGNDCPVSCPVVCGSEEMPCWGGYDPNECPMPDFCIPSKGIYLLHDSFKNKIDRIILK